MAKDADKEVGCQNITLNVAMQKLWGEAEYIRFYKLEPPQPVSADKLFGVPEQHRNFQ